MESPHDVLGVDPDADERAVVEAYRRRVKQAHPDHGGSPAEFQRVKAAYEAVVDAERPGEAGDEPDEGGPAEPPTRAPGHRRTDPGEEAGREDGPTDDQPTARVEYLDYEALTDAGWSLDDADLFEKADLADLDHETHGRFLNQSGDTLLGAAEDCGFTWPYSCRGGACANCAVAVCEGELSMPVDHILPEELLDRGIRLSCLGTPATEELKVVYNVKHLPDLEELLLPNHPFS